MKGPFHGDESDVKLGFVLAGSKLTLVLVQDITMPSRLSSLLARTIVLSFSFLSVSGS